MVIKTISICEACNARIPKTQPKLSCSLCSVQKHIKCQNLSKSDAEYILANPQYHWTCISCTLETLPINACPDSDPVATKIKCGSCNGYSYSLKNVKTCSWCDSQVHVKCLNDNLGCNKCCSYMIPGFNVNSYELIGNAPTNNILFNPYDRSHYVNQIGDMISNQEENDSTWNEISEFLTNCQYKTINSLGQPDSSNLKVLSLNIRSLTKNIASIRENYIDYQNFGLKVEFYS